MRQLQLFELHQLPKEKVPPKKTQTGAKKSKKIDDLDELKKTHHTHPEYKDTVHNSDKYIKTLSQLSFDRLGKNLDIIREQMEYAFKDKKYASYELLYEKEKQTMISRLLKFDMEEKQNRKKLKRKIMEDEIKITESN